jgi:hypothetical protein
MAPDSNPETFIHNNNHGESLQSHKNYIIFPFGFCNAKNGTPRATESKFFCIMKLNAGFKCPNFFQLQKCRLFSPTSHPYVFV